MWMVGSSLKGGKALVPVERSPEEEGVLLSLSLMMYLLTVLGCNFGDIGYKCMTMLLNIVSNRSRSLSIKTDKIAIYL